MGRENIYGTDDCAFAEGIAADALNPKGAGEDFWGATFDQDARSKGNTPQFEDYTAKAKTSEGTQSVPKSKGNH